MKKSLIIAIFGITVLTGCKVLRPNIMLETPANFEYSKLPENANPEYRIGINDRFTFQLLTNDGFKLIDIKSTMNNLQSQYQTQYSIEPDGTAKLPLIGRTSLVGKTLREAEIYLEEKYSIFYNKPFSIIRIENRRVIVFPGADGQAKIVRLLNDNMTLFEALAAAGGISSTGKAYKIKLIRGNLKNPQVFLFDLSTIDGMKNCDIVLQANDIIYVEPTFRVMFEVLQEIAPLISLVASVLIVFTTISVLNK